MEDSDSFFVYENWQADGHKARVHRGSCSFCNYGKGIHPGASEAHGRWHGPFTNLKKAVAVAQTSGGAMSLCKWCSPK